VVPGATEFREFRKRVRKEFGKPRKNASAQKPRIESQSPESDPNIRILDKSVSESVLGHFGCNMQFSNTKI
jgi:hypothetical protein